MTVDLGIDELNVVDFSHEPLSLGAHSEPSVDVQQDLKEKSITEDTLVWDSGGLTTTFDRLKWYTEIHPLAKPMTSSAKGGTGSCLAPTHLST